MSKPGKPPRTPVEQADSARLWVARSLTPVAERFPDLDPPDLVFVGLSPADTALALAVYRTTIQRWLSLRTLLDRFLSNKPQRLEPAMQAVLLSGAAQLAFFDRLPDYAVVDEAVQAARRLVRREASGMVNAVLRQVARLVVGIDRKQAWSPHPAWLPMPGGGVVKLKEPILPPVAELDKHLVAATSMPLRLVREWLSRFGEAQAVSLCLQGIEDPPTTLAVEPGFDAGAHAEACKPHQRDGFVVWTGPGESLRDFLKADNRRRVQDVASSLAVDATCDHKPETILDYCAGMGTKTRQLALLHPDARIDATDIHGPRRQALREAVAGLANVRVVEPDAVAGETYDLVLLDVPCSNTGVLARRPEARYRYSQQALGGLVQVQRQIVEQAEQWIKPGGLLLYSTCSVEPPENRKQVDRKLRRGGELLAEHQQMPGGAGDTYTDGSYHALIRC